MTESADLRLPVLSNAEDGRERIARELSQRIAGEVRFERHDRMLYATDASIYQVEPIGVVTPRDDADVEAVMAYAAEHRIPVLPRGAGTSLAGQTVNTALVLDFTPHCQRLLDVDETRRRARVQPGIVLDELNRRLAGRGLMFAPDVATASHATIGGMIGNNSAGAHSILYGRTVEHVLGLDVVLADGRRIYFDEGAAGRDERVRELTSRVADVVLPLADEIDERFPRTRRRVNGYNLDLMLQQLRTSTEGRFEHVNLAHLLCGAEGTLGVTVAADIGLVPLPVVKGLAIVKFPGIDDALAAVVEIIETAPAAVELIDDVIIDLARNNIEHRGAVDLLTGGGECPGAVLYVEYFADHVREINERFDALTARFGASSVQRYLEPGEMSRAWRLRKAGEPLLHGLPGKRKPITFIEDTAVDPTRLGEFVRRFRAMLDAHGTTASYYAHASVGCLHIRPLICIKDPDDVEHMQRIIEEATDLVRSFGGALSGEHGDGRLRSHLLERFYGPRLCEGFAAIRAIFDPEGRLNPGNITAPLPMLEHLRVKPADRLLNVPDVETFFRYEREHGFEGAVEMCNGAGVCRRMEGGTMCPSFRATRDERHATRGRGNALRLAITGQFNGSGPAWSDPETLRTLDLCLSCKACKSECPSNVDIARLKAEYLAQGYEHGVRIPLASRLMGDVRRLNAMAALAPGLANALMRFGPAAAVVRRLSHVDRRRSMPAFGPSLTRWHARRDHRGQGGDRHAAPNVIVFADCFTGFGESAIGRSAVYVLEALGYRVHVPDAGCCGRSMISNGLLRRAVATCSKTARALAAAVESTGSTVILGCEPSCVSAIVDDWPELRLTADRAIVADVAARTRLVEEFVADAWARHPRPLNVTGGASAPVLVHGHCHQKALWGNASTIGLLQRLEGTSVSAIDAGCCGMAGGFGFSPERFDLSQRIGELALFPAIRNAPDAQIIAPGTSCRHQVRDALAREAMHPIEYIAQRIGCDLH